METKDTSTRRCFSCRHYLSNGYCSQFKTRFGPHLIPLTAQIARRFDGPCGPLGTAWEVQRGRRRTLAFRLACAAALAAILALITFRA